MNPDKDVISELMMKHTRDINQLLDPNKAKARSSLNSLNKIFLNHKEHPLEKKVFFETYIIKNFIVILNHKSDSVRELTIETMGNIISLCEANQISLNEESENYIIERICSRVNTTNFAETVEEIRNEIVKLLLAMVKIFHIGIVKNMALIQQSVLSLLSDKYPEVKKQTSTLITQLALSHPNPFSLNVRGILLSLLKNCKHNRSKVRQQSSSALISLMSLPGVGEHMDDILTCLYDLQTDKNEKVAANAYSCIAICLNQFDIDNLKRFEDQLILFMLTGLTSPIHKQQCFSSLEAFASRRKEIHAKFKI